MRTIHDAIRRCLQRMVGLLRAIREAHTMRDRELPVKFDGRRYYYDAEHDYDQFRYNAARGEIGKWPRIEKLMEWLKAI